MWRDITCIVWKEWREQFGGRRLRGAGGILVTLASFGILLPLLLGQSWASSPASTMTWAWVPMFMVSTVIADAIAGERERHTLETLLATRLPDAAILFGKIAAAIAYAGGVSVTCLLLGLTTLAVTGRVSGDIARFVPMMGLALAVGFAVAILVAALGTFISLHARTVRQATQLLAGAVIITFMLPMTLVRMLPPSVKLLVVSDPRVLASLAPLSVVLVALLDAGVLWLLARRFTRHRLVLS